MLNHTAEKEKNIVLELIRWLGRIEITPDCADSILGQPGRT